MKLALLLFVSFLAVAPAAGHHSWFSRTWRKLIGGKSNQDQCLVSCDSSQPEGSVCGLMWASLTEVLTGQADQAPDGLFGNRRLKRSTVAMSSGERREAKRKLCCFLTEFPSALETCCGTLKHFCNSMPLDEQTEDTSTRLDKLTGTIRSVADKIGVNIDDLGLSWDEKQKIKDDLVTEE